MNSVTRYFPAFCDVDDSERVEVDFSTLDEMKEIPWLKKWTEGKEFSYFAQSGTYLMAILNDGREWWVAGFLKHPVDGLPQWKAPPRVED